MEHALARRAVGEGDTLPLLPRADDVQRLEQRRRQRAADGTCGEATQRLAQKQPLRLGGLGRHHARLADMRAEAEAGSTALTSTLTPVPSARRAYPSHRA